MESISMNKLDEYERAMIDVNQTLLLSALFIELTSEYKKAIKKPHCTNAPI